MLDGVELKGVGSVTMTSRRQTNLERLEAVAVYELPADLQSRLVIVRNAIYALKAEAARWGVRREFSPDGRFLGDLGELISSLFYGVQLTETQQKGHDATTPAVCGATVPGEQKVEVKLRSKSTIMDFSEVPDILLVIYVSPMTLKWGEICNGPGRRLLAHARRSTDGRLTTDCIKLLEAQRSVQLNEGLRRRTPTTPAP